LSVAFSQVAEERRVPVYIVSDLTPRNAEAFELYRTQAAPSIERYGGRYLARGGAIESLEGDWRPGAIVIVEFPNKAAALAWYRSPEYAEALAIRDEALSRDLIVVEGVPPPTQMEAGRRCGTNKMAPRNEEANSSPPVRSAPSPRRDCVP
jgi:uncharacterized protein (DUF1330 family)